MSKILAGILMVVISASCALAADLRAQLVIPDSAHVQILKFSDGTTSMGRITRIDSAAVQFTASFGEMTVAIGKIEEIRTVPVAGIKEGKYWFPNPNATRLFFGPTAHMLKTGKGYFSDYYVFFPAATYGINDHVTLGGGMSLVPGLGFDGRSTTSPPRPGSRRGPICTWRPAP
jgi:hypothetical protein